MQTETLELDREKARELYRKYREHQHWSEPIDQEIQRTYRLIAQGRVVIKALASVAAAGAGADGYPKLALCRADAETCHLSYAGTTGGVRMAAKERVRDSETRCYLDWPAGTFPMPPSRLAWARRRALVPLVPIHLRPKRGLANYHILFEALWRPEPPVDPMLLRRLGQGDLWVVVAAWDLTAVEQAALAARL